MTLYYCLVTGISPVSSTRLSRRTILQSVPRSQTGTIYELGAGWGRMAFPLARRAPGATVCAYEISPVPWLFMKLWAFLFGPRNLKIFRRNFLNTSLADASLVVCYLHPQALRKLAPKLARELAPRTAVISNTFDLPGWEPTEVRELEDVMCPRVLYYAALGTGPLPSRR